MTLFAAALNLCNLTHTTAAAYLGVSAHSVASWASARRAIPPGVWADLRRLWRQQAAASAAARGELAGARSLITEIAARDVDQDAEPTGRDAVDARIALDSDRPI